MLIEGARTVGEQCGLAVLQHRQGKRGCEQGGPLAARQLAEGVVDIADGATTVAPHDEVVLRLEKALGALLGFPDFPIPIGCFIKSRLQVAQLSLHLPDSGKQDADGAARGTKQRGNANGEAVGVVVGPLARGAG